MATPQWVRFSSTSRSVQEIFAKDLAPFYDKYGLTLWVITELGVLPDGGFGDISRPFIECDNLRQAFDLSIDWSGVALSFTVRAIHESVDFHVWRQNDKTNICLFIAPEMMWYESGGDGEGEWLVEFLEQLCLVLNAECCGYGRDPEYDFVYKPLEAHDILGFLRSGRLFQMHEPVIHLIRNDLISSLEIENLIKRYQARSGFTYRKSEMNYHILFNFRPEMEVGLNEQS